MEKHLPIENIPPVGNSPDNVVSSREPGHSAINLGHSSIFKFSVFSVLKKYLSLTDNFKDTIRYRSFSNY